jgi:HSP20 family protein
VRLPDTIDEEQVKASFDKGVLTVEVPKTPEATREPKKIQIGASKK